VFILLITVNIMFRIDGTEDDGSCGRLINDSSKCPTATAKKITIDGDLCIAFFAIKDIDIGEEITYRYGGVSRNYWWRSSETVSIDFENKILAYFRNINKFHSVLKCVLLSCGRVQCIIFRLKVY
jgi:hypothetical protein